MAPPMTDPIEHLSWQLTEEQMRIIQCALGRGPAAHGVPHGGRVDLGGDATPPHVPRAAAASVPSPPPPVRRPASQPEARRPNLVPPEVAAAVPQPGAVPNAVDEIEAKRMFGGRASLSHPRGHASRGGCTRWGGPTMSKWTCNTCNQDVMVVPRAGRLQAVPVFFDLEDCDASADPPNKKVEYKGRRKTTIPTPPYPWKLPLSRQANPLPVPSERTATPSGTATAETWQHIGARVGARQVEELIQRFTAVEAERFRRAPRTHAEAHRFITLLAFGL